MPREGPGSLDLTPAPGRDKEADADPASRSPKSGGETLGPPGLPLPATLPPTLTCSGKSPNTDTISTPESCGQEARPLVTAAQVGAPQAAETPRPPPAGCASVAPRDTTLSPTRSPIPAPRAAPHPWTPGRCPGRPYPAGLPAPGGHQLPAHFRILGTERKGWGHGPGRGGGDGEAV